MSNDSSSSGGNIAGVGYDHIHRPLDPNDSNDMDGAGEFSWGEGLEPIQVRGKPPSEGGRYRGTSPPCEPQIGVGRH